MNASRTQLVREVLQPALDAGEIVVCDRFYDSTFAYQGYGRGLDLLRVQEIVQFAAPLLPDITFFFDRDPSEGLRTAHTERGKGTDRFEDESLAFHRRIYDGYLELVAAEPERFRIISYRVGDIAGIKCEVQERFDDFFKRNT